MDGCRNFGKPVPDPELRDFMNTLYNGWFQRWKAAATEAEFTQAVDEWAELMRDNEYPVKQNLALSLLYEIESRVHHGYTEVTSQRIACVLGLRKYF